MGSWVVIVLTKYSSRMGEMVSLFWTGTSLKELFRGCNSETFSSMSNGRPEYCQLSTLSIPNASSQAELKEQRKIIDPLFRSSNSQISREFGSSVRLICVWRELECATISLWVRHNHLPENEVAYLLHHEYRENYVRLWSDNKYEFVSQPPACASTAPPPIEGANKSIDYQQEEVLPPFSSLWSPFFLPGSRLSIRWIEDNEEEHDQRK